MDMLMTLADSEDQRTLRGRYTESCQQTWRNCDVS